MKIFLSHSSVDKALVDAMRRALDSSGQIAWLDARELRGGDILEDKIRTAIEDAEAFIVFVSNAGLQSKWVGKELTAALDIQKQRGRDAFPVLPVSIDDTKLGVLEQFFDGEPKYIAVRSKPVVLRNRCQRFLLLSASISPFITHSLRPNPWIDRLKNSFSTSPARR